jgi:hypothetical protein
MGHAHCQPGRDRSVQSAYRLRFYLALTNALGFVTWARNWRLVTTRDNVNLPFHATPLRSTCCAVSSWRATHSAKAPPVRRKELFFIEVLWRNGAFVGSFGLRSRQWRSPGSEPELSRSEG